MTDMNKRSATKEAALREQGRREAGAYLRQLRLTNGLTQLQLARLLGIDWYTMIGQVERGTVGLPPWQMHLWADAFGVGRAVFAKRLLLHYEPHYWEMIYGDASGAK